MGLSDWYSYNGAAGVRFYPALYDVAQKAHEAMVGVVRDSVIAVRELTGLQLPAITQYLHDSYFHGKYWLYDFTIDIDVIPVGKGKFYVKLNVASFPADWFGGFEDVKGFKKARTVPVVVGPVKMKITLVNRDVFGDTLDQAVEGLDFDSYVKGQHYRTIKEYIQAALNADKDT